MPPPESDRPTLVLCLACGGHFEVVSTDDATGKYRMVQCQWCDHGSMDEKRIKAWMAHKRGRPPAA